ncbi:guanitoxin biosynthesis MBL fold metallo-hydrolase GntH [Agarivorans sp. B2Z047]|uniref:guanitoxin biosynthesis MBL fold metallo-hydrolase GntH n=1 Tax=Agarivorans sp. B2Z047 TaxID=2652721 RepID=UPI001883994B|nr:guanitoxin biosynthesis MBL fold metallo-hydrolase GntH [Agarivorans sp. B2Z047]UQN40971.1 MBL fold metallo-hydrolase [Agarivorans sp. B2Z047]
MKFMFRLIPLALCSAIVAPVSAKSPVDYQFPRECSYTEAGYPVPLCGEPLTKHEIVKKVEGEHRQYSKHFIAGHEAIAPDEMRITTIGSGNPLVRMGQASTSWLVELGNGDNFIFDIGGGTVPALWSLGLPHDSLDKVFVTHLHLDHVGGIFNLWDSMGWGRNTPLKVWGSSGHTPELGLNHFIGHVEQAAAWHLLSKTGIAAREGMQIEAHEFDYAKFSPKQPKQLVYAENEVKIYAFPVDHILVGSVGYRLEWNGLSMAFTGDSEPTRHEAEMAKGVDVFIHELFIDAPTFSKKNNMPIEVAEKVIDKHTSARELGKVFNIAQPVLGVGTHFFTNDDTIDAAFKGLAETYSGPVAIAQDLMVINVTKEQVVTRMARTDQLVWSTPSAPDATPTYAPAPTEGLTPEWVSDTRL